jgi:phage protein D
LTVDGTDIPVMTQDTAVLRFSEGLGLLDALTVTFSPTAGDWTTSVALGKEYTLVLSDGDGDDQTFTGLIVAMTMEQEHAHDVVVAQGVDKFFKLKHKWRTRVWDELSPKDILGEIAGDHGLTADYKGPELVASTWFQEGTSDAAFLHGLAKRYGCYVRAREDKLVFARLPVPAAGLTVTAWDDLLSLTVTIGLDGLLTEVGGRAWDPETDKEVKAKSAGKFQDIGGSGSTGKSVWAAEVGGTSVPFVGAAPFLLEGHLSAMVDARVQTAALGLVTGSAVVHGLPTAVSGRSLTVENCGTMSGIYLITGSEHELNEDIGFSARLALVSDSLPEGEA